MGLINFYSDETEMEINPKKRLLVETNELTADNRKKRSRCTGCYGSLAEKEVPSIARRKAKLVSTKCSQGPT